MKRAVIPMVLAGLLACPMAWADEVSPDQPTYEEGGYSDFQYDGQWSTDVTDETQWDGVEHAHIGAGDWAAQEGDSVEQPLPGPTNERVEVQGDGMSFWSDGSRIGARVDSLPENTEGWDNWSCQSSGNANFWWVDGNGDGQVDYVTQSCYGWNNPPAEDPEPQPVPYEEPTEEPSETPSEPAEEPNEAPEVQDPTEAPTEPSEGSEEPQTAPQEETTEGATNDTEQSTGEADDSLESGTLDTDDPVAGDDGPVAEEADQPVPSASAPATAEPSPEVADQPAVSASPSPAVETKELARTGSNVPGAAAFVTLCLLAGVTVETVRRYSGGWKE